MKFGNKLPISSKKNFNGEFAHNKTYVNAGKNLHKRRLSMFCVPVILQRKRLILM